MLPEKYSGRSTQEKFKIIGNKVKECAESKFKDKRLRLLITHLDDICWLTNLRGSDIPYNPVFFAYALLYVNGEEIYLDLYSDKERFDSEEIQKYLKENKINLKPYSEIYEEIGKKYEDLITITSADEPNYALSSLIIKSASFLFISKDLIEHEKYVKNPVEVEGFKKANIRDSVALIKFFAWMENELINKQRKDLNEYEIGLKSKEFREQQELFMGESFAPICGAGPNGAIIHYEQTATKHSDMSIDKIILCDTGGQYMDGTTDITRTVHYGTPTEKEKEMYTRVLLGNLSLERLTFNEMTGMDKLDSVPRSFLNMVGEDYKHGTSHGVGHFLNVHEGPYGVKLMPGVIKTNEPGFYLKDNFGIRIENEVLVVKKGERLGFENITPLPYEKNLIDINLLSPDMVNYIDKHHKWVWDTLSPLLEGDNLSLEYLKKKVKPLMD
ncbi:MAG: aminopeptidase P family protein [archaeon]|nr:aminopeptidase P family protein [archaeon]